MGYSILIVDDSSIVRRSLIKTLKLANVSIDAALEAGNGLEALNILSTNSVDIVFLDINMPVMNGMEFMERIRADEKYKSLAVVIISTEGSKERIDQLTDYQIKAYLRKPFSPERLAETFEIVMKGN